MGSGSGSGSGWVGGKEMSLVANFHNSPCDVAFSVNKLDNVSVLF